MNDGYRTSREEFERKKDERSNISGCFTVLLNQDPYRLASCVRCANCFRFIFVSSTINDFTSFQVPFIVYPMSTHHLKTCAGESSESRTKAIHIWLEAS